MAATGQAAGGEGAAQGQGGEAAQGQQQAQGADLGQLSEQIGALGGGLEDMRQFLAGNPWAQQPDQGQQQDDGLDLSWLNPEQQSPLDDPAALSQKLNEVISGAVSQQAQALLAPIQERQEAMRRDQEARDLASEFPELATDEMAQKVAGRGGLAEQLAAQLGQPGLAAEPKFWRIAYMASKAAESANQGSGDTGAAHLEGGGGPGPAQMTEADLVKQIAGSGDGLGAGVLNGI